MVNGWLVVAGGLGAAGVTLGAFGAHILRPVLPLQAMTIFETAVQYHLIHALALLAVAILLQVSPLLLISSARVPSLRLAALRWSAWGFLVGTVLFSGSLYLLATTGVGWLGAITPLGGVCWIAAWLILGYSARPYRT